MVKPKKRDGPAIVGWKRGDDMDMDDFLRTLGYIALNFIVYLILRNLL